VVELAVGKIPLSAGFWFPTTYMYPGQKKLQLVEPEQVIVAELPDIAILFMAKPAANVPPFPGL
jgi:hypothetical protein